MFLKRLKHSSLRQKSVRLVFDDPQSFLKVPGNIPDIFRIEIDKQAYNACLTKVYYRKKEIKGSLVLGGIEGNKCNLIYSRFGPFFSLIFQKYIFALEKVKNFG